MLLRYFEFAEPFWIKVISVDLELIKQYLKDSRWDGGSHIYTCCFVGVFCRADLLGHEFELPVKHFIFTTWVSGCCKISLIFSLSWVQEAEELKIEDEVLPSIQRPCRTFHVLVLCVFQLQIGCRWSKKPKKSTRIMRDASTKSFQVWDMPDAVSDILNVYIVTGAFWKKLGLGAWRNNFGIPVRIVLHFGLSFSTQVHTQLFYSSKSLAYGVQNLMGQKQKAWLPKTADKAFSPPRRKAPGEPHAKLERTDERTWISWCESCPCQSEDETSSVGSSPIPSYCNHEIFEKSDPNSRKTHPFDTGTTPKKPWSHKVDSYEVRLSKHFESAIERMNRELPPEHRHAGMRWR